MYAYPASVQACQRVRSAWTGPNSRRQKAGLASRLGLSQATFSASVVDKVDKELQE